ncbi:tail fiber assembly protein [Pseudomonas saponiphila]|uniref:tail fiber assembly protein n=1 Tax=Pseudomonas saponiphila TaxID=556534 RepID=UPI0022401D98|nr:tail fiber assembly protein [Pseudomonas saponiphila]
MTQHVIVTDGKVTSWFAGDQGLNGQVNIIEIEDDDPMWLAWVSSLEPDSLAEAVAQRDKLLSLAALRIAPLQYAADLDDASADDLALLKKWKKYSVAVNRMDLNKDPVLWPEQP